MAEPPWKPKIEGQAAGPSIAVLPAVCQAHFVLQQEMAVAAAAAGCIAGCVAVADG